MAKGSSKQPQKIPAQHPRIHVNHVQASTFSGPLPPPDIMEGYNNIVPNAAERIITVFESEVKHRHDLERAQVDDEKQDRIRAHRLILLGQVMGFILAVAFIVSGTFLIFHDKQVSGTIVSTTAMLGIIAAFLNSHKKK